MSLVTFFWLEVYFVWYDFTHFLLTLFAWNIIFHLLILSVCLSLELRWVFWRQHIVGSCFLIHLATLCLLIGEFNPFIFRVLINENAVLSFYLFLFSGCSISLLFLFACASLCHFSLVVFYDIYSVSSFLMFHVSTLDLCFVVTMTFV